MAMLERYWFNPVMAPDTTPVELLLFFRRVWIVEIWLEVEGLGPITCGVPSSVVFAEFT